MGFGDKTSGYSKDHRSEIWLVKKEEDNGLSQYPWPTGFDTVILNKKLFITEKIKSLTHL